MSDTAALSRALKFDNRFVRDLPGDTSREAGPRQVLGACYSDVRPKLCPQPRVLAVSADVAASLGLTETLTQSEEFAEVFTGNKLLPGMKPYAMCYGGHQFGHWAGQLGDGRAINLGEAATVSGHLTMQLKGAGPTPYSRHADGFAVLRSSVREFLCSEAMHHLGVPTTRALSLATTGNTVVRDMFYDGNPVAEPGAVVCRVAKSFVRFGSFEIFAQRGEHELLRQLADFTIKADFPELLNDKSGVSAPEGLNADGLDKDTYVRWFREVVLRTARLMAHWMRVGFVHGVMNTDNMSIIGDTIDYGPYGWLEGYDPEWTPNTTDAEGRRYCYGAQPNIGLWNLIRLANALFPLVGEAAPLEEALGLYSEEFGRCRTRDMAAKLGFAKFSDTDGDLVDDLFKLLQLAETDMTIFFRQLAKVSANMDGHESLRVLNAAYYQAPSPDVIEQTQAWLQRYQRRSAESLTAAGETDADRQARMNSVNPKYVLRNYLAQQAIEQSEQGDLTELHQLMTALKNPYAEQPDYERYAQKRPEWARVKLGCSMLSCSS